MVLRQIVNKLFQNAKKEKKGKGFKHAEKICAILYTGNTETNGRRRLPVLLWGVVHWRKRRSSGS